MKALHGRLPIPQSATALPGILRTAADRLEAWIYDHANLSRWDGEDVTAEWAEAVQAIRPAQRICVHHVPAGVPRSDFERAVADAMSARRRGPRCR